MTWCQYSPSYNDQAAAEWKRTRKWNFDSSHEISDVDNDGVRRRIATFRYASDAEMVERLVNAFREGRLMIKEDDNGSQTIELSQYEALKDYAIDVTRALTGATFGGSEFFTTDKRFGFFEADIAACKKNIEWRRRKQMELGAAKERSSQPHNKDQHAAMKHSSLDFMNDPHLPNNDPMQIQNALESVLAEMEDDARFNICGLNQDRINRLEAGFMLLAAKLAQQGTI